MSSYHKLRSISYHTLHQLRIFSLVSKGLVMRETGIPHRLFHYMVFLPSHQIYSLYRYQKKISSYDKEEWETMVEQLLMRGTYRRRIVDFSSHARSYLIDVDLVRGTPRPVCLFLTLFLNSC